jgi:hypothetical protein
MVMVLASLSTLAIVPAYLFAFGLAAAAGALLVLEDGALVCAFVDDAARVSAARRATPIVANDFIFFIVSQI